MPADHELVIDEFLISDFSHSENNSDKQGQYKDAIEKLDYLSELGINAIELMPVNKSPGDYNWGYIPSYFFAPQPNYGSTQDLKRLIDECHARGIRVILDRLYNHSDVLRFWIGEYHIDGIRFDALKELDNYDFLYWITQEAKHTAEPKPFYNIGEHIPEKPDLVSPNGSIIHKRW